MSTAGVPLPPSGGAIGGAVAGRRLYLATPMYEGMCHALYTRGLVELALACRERDVSLRLHFVTNKPNLNQARALIAAAFLASDADHLMMIDADIGFAADDVLALLALQAGDPAFGVIGAAYSLKRVDWDRVGRAARTGGSIGLARVAAPLALNLAPGEGELALDRPQQVADLATGFMMVGRDTLVRLKEAHPELAFRPDGQDRAAFAIGENATAFFDTAIDGEGAYLSEDYAFCRRVRGAGMGVWLCPWIELTHTGNMAFAGSVSEIARLAAALQTQEIH